MHLQGGQRGEKVAQEGDVVHQGNRVHEYEVIDAGHHHVVLRHRQTGTEDRFGAGEFNEMFEAY